MLLHEMLKEIKDSAYIKKITQDSVTKKKGDFKDSSDVLTQDPLTEKGEKIMSNMKEQYGEKKGEQVFYASKNKGTIEGVDSKTKDQSTRLASLKRQLEQAKRTGGDQEYVKELEEEIVQLEKEDQGRQTQDESKPIVEIYPTGDPFGRGFEASQSVDGGKSWVYRGDLGRQSREFWRTYCQTKGYTLRTRDAASKSLKVKTKDAVLCGYYKGFQIHQVSDSKFTAFTNFGSSQPGVELIGNSIDDIKNKIDQYDKKSQSGNDYSEKEMNTRDSKTKDESPAIGKHSDVPDDQFNQEELQKGIEIEKEHTDDPELAKQIAKDHLSEVRDYYTRLIAMEAEAKENKTENDLEDNQ